MQQSQLNSRTIVGAILVALATAALIDGDRQAAGRRIQAAGAGFQSPCGTAEVVSARVGRCLDQIFELVGGNFEEPKSDSDIVFHCQKFNHTERCIRGISKDCLSGIHKTAVGAVASATKRFRSAECKNEQGRFKYIDTLKCAKTTGKAMDSLYRDYTSMAQTIRDLPVPPEQKLTKICCLLVVLDRDIAKVFDAVCPKSTSVVLGILHAITDDARNTLCLSPKCQGALNGIQATQLKQNQNFIEPVMQVLFQLADS